MTLKDMLDAPSGDTSWSTPRIFDYSNSSDRVAMEELHAQGQIQAVFDPIDHIADELFELTAGANRTNQVSRNEYTQKVLSLGLDYGRWVHFPWNKSLVRFAPPDEHYHLRTFRNRELITVTEQDEMRASRIAIFGLSVGSNVIDLLCQMGIGSHVLFGDPDTIRTTNLNRMRATMSDVGSNKIDTVARRISELDPYVEQWHCEGGFGDTTVDDLERFNPSVLIDEVDDLRVKAQMRDWARKAGVPVLMATDVGEKATLDVERYDLGEGQPFNGRIPEELFSEILRGELPQDKKLKTLIKIGGPRHLSARMLVSALHLNDQIGGIPQLASASLLGSALVNVAVRQIVTGQKLASGTYLISPRRTLRLPHQHGPLLTGATVLRLAWRSRS